jgi:septal ring factor EnvC (AmiA/AmiB activator)
MWQEIQKKNQEKTQEKTKIKQQEVNDYTRQKNSIETRIQDLQDVEANIQKNPRLAAKFNTESDRAAKQLKSKDKDGGYLRQRSDGTPRLTRHMGLMVRATLLLEGALGTNLYAKSSKLDGGFTKALGDAEKLNPKLRTVIDSPSKKMTISQFADIGNPPAISKDLKEQKQVLETTEKNLAKCQKELAKLTKKDDATPKKS